jgi:hypothetical protein
MNNNFGLSYLESYDIYIIFVAFHYLFNIMCYFFFFLQKCVDKLKEGDKVKVLDPYDGDVVGIGRIHSLSILHGINLKGSEDANVNILKVTSNVPLAYEDKIDGAVRLKEKEGTFTRWPLKYLQKMT